jgi:hypothetical protein
MLMEALGLIRVQRSLLQTFTMNQSAATISECPTLVEVLITVGGLIQGLLGPMISCPS